MGCFHVLAMLGATAVLTMLARPTIAADAPPSSPVFWHEAEDAAQAPDAIGPFVAHRDFGSGGACLQGASLPKKGCTVTYQLDIPQGIAHAQIIFRYARLHWRPTMTPAHIAVEITNGGDTVKGVAEFVDTKGWGYKPAHWQLASAKLGPVNAGKCTLKLIGQSDDNDASIDGFFIAPEDFVIGAGELTLNGLAISGDGYMGLQSTPTIRQDTEPTLRVAVRSFSSKEPAVTLAIGKTAESAVALKSGASDKGQNGAILASFELPALDDGPYVLVLTGQSPPARLVVPVVLAGQFITSLDKNIVPIEAFSAELAKSAKPDEQRCAADFEHIVAYLKAGEKTLTTAAEAPVDAYKQGLAAKEGVVTTAPIVDDMRRALDQARETMRRLQAGEDPYAGRTGDLRRAYRSAASGELRVYRVLVPENYAKADKVPFLLMLHGGGGDENEFPNLEGGAVRDALSKRGYIVACPAYNSRTPGFVADQVQLIELMKKEFPKVDPARIYCTGLSMGGFSTYTMATTHPEIFAAICCVSGTGRPDVAEKLKTVPTMILQGGADAVVPPAGAKRVEARMKELGETVDLHIFPVNGHDYKGLEYLNLSLDFFDKYKKQ